MLFTFQLAQLIYYIQFFPPTQILLAHFNLIYILNSPYNLHSCYFAKFKILSTYKKDANFAEPKLVRNFTNFAPKTCGILRYFTIPPKRKKTAGNTKFPAVKHSFKILSYIPICFASFLRRSCNPVFITSPSALQLRRQSFLLF